MLRAFLIFVGLIIYGSLYPFDFTASLPNLGKSNVLLEFRLSSGGRGDILSNVLLFIPYGLFGMLGITKPENTSIRFLLIMLLGLLLAIGLQIMQLYLPSRVPSLGDAALNGVGIAIGGLAGLIPACRRLLQDTEHSAPFAAPAMLIAAWLAYRLTPFVPSLDLQLIKNSLKPLLLNPIISPLGIFQDFVAWLIVFHLSASMTRRSRHEVLVILMISLVFTAEIFIIHNWLSADNVAGAAMALVVWLASLRAWRRRAGLLAILLLVLLGLNGLAPFELRTAPAAFNWVPFASVLSDHMFFNVAVLTEKTFYYGSLIWLLLELRFNRTSATLSVMFVLAVIEGAQTRLAHHTPEITDPLLALLIAILLSVISGSGTSKRPVAS